MFWLNVNVKALEGLLGAERAQSCDVACRACGEEKRMHEMQAQASFGLGTLILTLKGTGGGSLAAVTVNQTYNKI